MPSHTPGLSPTVYRTDAACANDADTEREAPYFELCVPNLFQALLNIMVGVVTEGQMQLFESHSSYSVIVETGDGFVETINSERHLTHSKEVRQV